MLRRIYAMVLRQIYLIRQSPPRLLTYVFWPTIFMLIWGFLNKYLYLDTQQKKFVFSTFLGANLLLSVFERANLNVMMAFLEDVWARNVGNILISPISTVELIIGILLNGFIGLAIGISMATLIAYMTFDYNLFSIGLPLLGFLLNLILTGWAVGLMILAVIFYFGMSAEFMGWMMAFLMTPFVCAYYPVSVLPPSLQIVAHALPPTYAFEGLRYWLEYKQFNWDMLFTGLMLNAVYLVIGVVILVFAMRTARKQGGLLLMGE